MPIFLWWFLVSLCGIYKKKIQKMYRKFVRKIISTATRNNLFWTLIRPFNRISESLSFYRKRNEYEKAVNKLNDYFSKKEVIQGPFKGLKYPYMVSFGSALYPKLAGYYESELFPLIEKLISLNNFDSIINIGCAEGYYAVGLSLKFKNIQVYAYDINPECEKALLEFAKANHIEDRMHFKLNANTDIFKKFPASTRHLVFCDCEGFEAYIFNKKSINYLQNSYIIIESHETISHGVTNDLIKLFINTHFVEIYYVKSKEEKFFDHRDSLKKFNIFEKEICINEGRSHSKAWLYFEPRNSETS